MATALLLDTHVLQWWWCSPALLSEQVHDRLSDRNQEVMVSAVSWLELSVALADMYPKARHPADPGLAALLRRFPEELIHDGFTCLPLQPSHLQRASRMGGACQGWAGWVDRLLVAQTQQEGLRLVSLDPGLAQLGEPLIW